MAYRVQPDELLERWGRTYAEEARITLRDKPAPLFQLLVLTQLSATRIGADVAAATAGELFAAGWRTPDRLLESTWQQRVNALGRGGYRRYDESTATRLAELATAVRDDLRGDLRRLGDEADGSVPALRSRLEVLPRIGPTGSGIFCREVQAVWTWVRPFFDDRALRAARRLGYPSAPADLAALVPEDRLAELSSALIRWSLDPSDD